MLSKIKFMNEIMFCLLLYFKKINAPFKLSYREGYLNYFFIFINLNYLFYKFYKVLLSNLISIKVYLYLRKGYL